MNWIGVSVIINFLCLEEACRFFTSKNPLGYTISPCNKHKEWCNHNEQTRSDQPFNRSFDKVDSIPSHNLPRNQECRPLTGRGLSKPFGISRYG